MAFMRAQHIAHLLLGGYIDSTALETALTTNDQFAGAWKRLLRSGTAKALIASPASFDIIAGSATAFGQLLELSGAQLAASDSATEAISNNSTAIKTVVTNSTYLNLWNNVPANKTRLQARINASGSKLKRQEWTSSGTWTAPGTPIVALSIFAVGGGGNGGAGGNAGSAQAGCGGSGAESKTVVLTSSLPVSNQTVTVGSSTAASSFGSIATASAGVNGGTGTNAQTTGGGTDSGSIYDTSPTTAIFQPTNASKQGGVGGAGFSNTSNFNGQTGGAGLTGSGGSGGSSAGGSALGGGAGTGFGSGGGSGSGIWPSGAAAGSGSAASANTGSGGGGGGASASTTGAGSLGGSGLVIAYWVEG